MFRRREFPVRVDVGPVFDHPDLGKRALGMVERALVPNGSEHGGCHFLRVIHQAGEPVL